MVFKVPIFMLIKNTETKSRRDFSCVFIIFFHHVYLIFHHISFLFMRYVCKMFKKTFDGVILIDEVTIYIRKKAPLRNGISKNGISISSNLHFFYFKCF